MLVVLILQIDCELTFIYINGESPQWGIHGLYPLLSVCQSFQNPEYVNRYTELLLRGFHSHQNIMDNNTVSFMLFNLNLVHNRKPFTHVWMKYMLYVISLKLSHKGVPLSIICLYRHVWLHSSFYLRWMNHNALLWLNLLSRHSLWKMRAC